MNTLILCLIITTLIVYGYDYLQFPQEITSRFLTIVLHRNISADCVKLPKIFECSLCASTWCTLLILLVMQPQLWFLAFAYGFITPYILGIMNIADSAIRLLLLLASNLIKKIEKLILHNI